MRYDEVLMFSSRNRENIRRTSERLLWGFWDKELMRMRRLTKEYSEEVMWFTDSILDSCNVTLHIAGLWLNLTTFQNYRLVCKGVLVTSHFVAAFLA